MEDGFADATVDAAIYVICFAPDRLPQFLAEHPPGAVLERIARRRIAAARAQRHREAMPSGQPSTILGGG